MRTKCVVGVIGLAAGVAGAEPITAGTSGASAGDPPPAAIMSLALPSVESGGDASPIVQPGDWIQTEPGADAGVAICVLGEARDLAPSALDDQGVYPGHGSAGPPTSQNTVPMPGSLALAWSTLIAVGGRPRRADPR